MGGPGRAGEALLRLLLIPKSDKKTLSKIKEAIEAAKKEAPPTSSRVRRRLKLPLRDGDEERADGLPGYTRDVFHKCEQHQ